MRKRTDRRKGLRYGLQVPVRFSWKSFPGARFHAEGVTRDVSVHGAYIYTSTCPPIHAVLRTEILLPRISGRGDIRAKGELQVQRVERDLRGSSPTGFAGNLRRLTVPVTVDSP